MEIPKIASTKKKIPPLPPKSVKRPEKNSGPKVHGKAALAVETRDMSRFTIEEWHPTGTGQKILVYGMTGMGKTTLAALLGPGAVFIGADDGGRLMRNPLTGERLRRVPQINDFQDMRDLTQSEILLANDVTDVVIDTFTEVHRWAIPYILQTVMKDKGHRPKNLEDYGWRKGYGHWCRAIGLLLNDLQRLVYAGKNVILLCQETGIKITNESGEDYRTAGPDLYHDSQVSILNLTTSWCDHIFRINYANIMVDKKKAVSNNDRAIFTHPTINFIAKSRTIPIEWASVTFANKKDNSVWRLLENPEQARED